MINAASVFNTLIEIIDTNLIASRNLSAERLNNSIISTFKAKINANRKGLVVTKDRNVEIENGCLIVVEDCPQCSIGLPFTCSLSYYEDYNVKFYGVYSTYDKTAIYTFDGKTLNSLTNGYPQQISITKAKPANIASISSVMDDTVVKLVKSENMFNQVLCFRSSGSMLFDLINKKSKCCYIVSLDRENLKEIIDLVSTLSIHVVIIGNVSKFEWSQ